MFNAIIRSAIAIAVAIFAGRQLLYGGRDLARYNKMREMSGDAPLLKPVRTNTPTNAEARTRNPFVMLMSIPSDVKRYLALKSM